MRLLKLITPTLICVLFTFHLSYSQSEARHGYTQAKDYSSAVFLKWNTLFLEIERYAPGYRPCPTAQALAYMGLSAYESVVQGMSEFSSLQGEWKGLNLPAPSRYSTYHYAAIVNENYYVLMKYFFDYLAISNPQMYNKIELTYKSFKETYSNNTPPSVVRLSETYGGAVAKAIIEWEKTDKIATKAYLTPRPSSYKPPVGLGLWQPTLPDFGAALYPYWGDARTFAIKEKDKICPPPLSYSEKNNSPIYKEALEVYQAVNKIKNKGNYEERWKAEFWSDDIENLTFSPAARYISLANQIVKKANLNLAQCAELYAKLGLALNDATVATWKSKYYYNVERPISYIRRILKNNYPDATTWTTILNNPLKNVQGLTPAFPAYPAGHASFAGAGSAIFSSLYSRHPLIKNGYGFVDYSHYGRIEFIGTPRVYTSFKQMGEENAYSRIPLGVHFRMDCSSGLTLGELAAMRVLKLPWKKKYDSLEASSDDIDEVSDKTVQVFPNPASQSIQVDLFAREGKAVNLTVFNSIGQAVLSKNIEKATEAPVFLDINHLKEGNYILHISSKNQKDIVRKFTVYN